MGMVGRISKRWNDLNRNYVASSGRASDVGGGLGAMSKVLRRCCNRQFSRSARGS